MNKIRIAHLFGDCDNGGASGVMDYDNGIWQHVLNVPRVPLEKKLSDQQIAKWCRNNGIDVLFCTMWGTFVAGTQKPARGVVSLKEEYPQLKVIGLADEPLMVDWCSRYGGPSEQMKISQGYIDGLSDFDAIATICDHEVSFYESFNERVYNLGLPFPDKAYENLIRKDARKEKGDDLWVGLGVGGNAFTRYERNYLVALAAVEKAKTKLTAAGRSDIADRIKGILLSWTEKSDMNVIQAIKDRYPWAMFQMRTKMEDYLHFLQSCDCVVSPIVRDTPGRLVGECAYFKVPIFGSDVPDLQKKLFPDFTASPWDVNFFANCVSNFFINGRETYQKVIDSGHDALIYRYGAEKMKNRFRDMLIDLEIGDSWHEVDQEEEVYL